MIRAIRVVIDDLDWPNLRCAVESRGKEVSRSSLYDTANSNFEPMLTNELMFVVRDIVREKKDEMQQDRQQFRPNVPAAREAEARPRDRKSSRPARPATKHVAPKKVAAKKKRKAR